MLFTSLGRSVLGKNCAIYLNYRCSRPWAQCYPIQTFQPVNNIFITDLYKKHTPGHTKIKVLRCVMFKTTSIHGKFLGSVFNYLCAPKSSFIAHTYKLGGLSIFCEQCFFTFKKQEHFSWHTCKTANVSAHYILYGSNVILPPGISQM